MTPVETLTGQAKPTVRNSEDLVTHNIRNKADLEINEKSPEYLSLKEAHKIADVGIVMGIQRLTTDKDEIKLAEVRHELALMREAFSPEPTLIEQMKDHIAKTGDL